jgi:hypothetical protein
MIEGLDSDRLRYQTAGLLNIPIGFFKEERLVMYPF